MTGASYPSPGLRIPLLSSTAVARASGSPVGQSHACSPSARHSRAAGVSPVITGRSQAKASNTLFGITRCGLLPAPEDTQADVASADQLRELGGWSAGDELEVAQSQAARPLAHLRMRLAVPAEDEADPLVLPLHERGGVDDVLDPLQRE